MSKRWNIAFVVIALFFSVLITYFSMTIEIGAKYWTLNAEDVEVHSLINQEVIDVLEKPRVIRKLFYEDELIGVINDMDELNQLLDTVTNERYREDFPDTKAQLGEDVYVLEENSFFVYENKDKEIADFISNNDLFSIEADRVEFSNGYYIYVRDLAEFEEARNKFLLNFISQDELTLLLNNKLPPSVSEFGESRAISINVLESTRYSRGYTSIENILMDEKEYMDFLSYGFEDREEMEPYIVERYDTVAGVGSKNGLSAQQVVTINSDRLSSVNEVLTEGMQLNVTYFQSPINVVVEREAVVQEIVYPGDPIYEEDPSMRAGVTITKKEEVRGYNQVIYKETYINGVLQEGAEVISSVEVKAAEKAIIIRGTLILPGVGSGTFRYPVDNASVSCGWFCYANHTATDLQDRYNRYGPIYAADSGIIVESGYAAINGYYVWIDHQNGYRTYYGHMHTEPYYSAGVVVQKGDVIGQIGQTGRATGPHVHFVIEHQGVRYNPCIYLGC